MSVKIKLAVKRIIGVFEKNMGIINYYFVYSFTDGEMKEKKDV